MWLMSKQDILEDDDFMQLCGFITGAEAGELLTVAEANALRNMGSNDPVGHQLQTAATSAQAAQDFSALHAHDLLLLDEAPEVQQQLAVEQPAQPCDAGDRHDPAAAAAAAAAAAPQDDSEGMAVDDDPSSEPQTEEESGYPSAGEDMVVSEQQQQQQQQQQQEEEEEEVMSEEEGEAEGGLAAAMDYIHNEAHYTGVCRHESKLRAQVHVGHNIKGVGKSVSLGVYEASTEEADKAARRWNEARDFMSRGVPQDTKLHLLLRERNQTPGSLYPAGYVPGVLPRLAGAAANSFKAWAAGKGRRIHAVPADDPSSTGQSKYFDLTYCDCGPKGCNQPWLVVVDAAKDAKS